MFEMNLPDLVKGLRANEGREQAFIAEALKEIKDELKNPSPRLKAQAIEKLIYLHGIHNIDVSWAGFYMVELMSAAAFAHRRIAYLGASETFTIDLEVLLLTTHCFKKAFSTSHKLPPPSLLSRMARARGAGNLSVEFPVLEKSLALSCLARVADRSLAEMLLDDVLSMTSSQSPLLAKKAICCAYKLLQRYPQGLPVAYERIKPRLLDTEAAVVTASVTVLCELASKNPSNYIGLLPSLYGILTTSSNNWLLIKTSKLLAMLQTVEIMLPNKSGELEPMNLPAKLNAPLLNIITTSNAKSVQFECLKTVIVGIPKISENPTMLRHTARVCVEVLGGLIEERDPNLKYMGLLGFALLQKYNPNSLTENSRIVVECLSDHDPTIQQQALEMLVAMISPSNLETITGMILDHLHETCDPAFAESALSSLLQLCGARVDDSGQPSKSGKLFGMLNDNYHWYMELLVRLSTTNPLQGFISVQLANVIAVQVQQLYIRLQEMESIAQFMAQVLLHLSGLSFAIRVPLQPILFSSAWIVGESSSVYTEQQAEALIHALLDPPKLDLNEYTLSICVHAASKLALCHPPLFELASATLLEYTSNPAFEVQERAWVFYNLLEMGDIKPFDVPRLLPVNSKAQSMVPVPDGLDLNAWINDPPVAMEDLTSPSRLLPVAPWENGTTILTEEQEEALLRRAESERKARETNIFYIKGDNDSHTSVGDVQEQLLVGLDLPQIQEVKFGVTSGLQKYAITHDEAVPANALSIESPLLDTEESLANIQLFPSPKKKEKRSKPKPSPKVIEETPRRKTFLCGDDNLCIRYAYAGDCEIEFTVEFIANNSERLRKVVLALPVNAEQVLLLGDNNDLVVQVDGEEVSDEMLHLLLAEKKKFPGVYTTTVRLPCTAISGEEPLLLHGEVHYSLKLGDGTKVSKLLECRLRLDVSYTISPRPVALAELQTLLKECADALTLISKKYYLQTVTPDQARTLLAQVCSLGLVKNKGHVSTYYGTTCLGQHVAVLLKIKDETASVEIKCSDATIGNALLTELDSVLL